MKEFGSIAHFVTHLAALEAAETLALHHGLKRVAVAVEKSAKAEIGEYQPQVGPFNAWEELAESTQADRVRKGFSPDEPLLRTGELRESISHEVSGLEAVIGSTSDIMVYQEIGTSRIPPRPVLGPAAYHNKHKIKKILGEAAVSGLIGGERIHASLGYDID